MKPYELTYLISSEVSEEEATAIQNKIISLIQEKEGFSAEGKPPFKKRLAYSVQGQPQAYLAVLNFQMVPEKLAGLEKELKEEKRILRYLILVKPPVKKEKAVRRPRKTVADKEGELRPILSEEEKKVELKEIEKKLDEILKEE
ncbi:MAG TPA: 30S ribosomal protein S6 [Patescibacteria group bacterium]|nr:30S ribosomal protein S6 [Patescibacteria group bacterium]